MRLRLVLATALLVSLGSTALAQTGTDAASPNGAAAVSPRAASANVARSKPAAKTHHAKAKMKPASGNSTGGADAGASPSGPG